MFFDKPMPTTFYINAPPSDGMDYFRSLGLISPLANTRGPRGGTKASKRSRKLKQAARRASRK